MTNSVETFVSDYTSAHKRQIAFASNGHMGCSLEDGNHEFRLQVSKYVIDSPERCSDLLIRDLYDAETAFSADAFGVNHNFVSCLATELLKRGGEDNILHYLVCVSRGMDAYLSSQCVQLNSDERQ